MTVIQDVDISGDDAVNAFGNTVGRDLVIEQIRITRARPGLVLSDDEIAARARTYVRVARHRSIIDALAEERLVALSGPAGSGLETTAIACLRELLPASRIRRFSTGQDDLEEVAARMAGGYLLRARDEDPSQLRALRERVRAADAFAVVFGPPAEHRAFAEFLVPLEVEPPSSLDVYRSHLRDLGVPRRWLNWREGEDLVRNGSPRDAVRLARLVHVVGAQDGGAQEVVNAYRHWREELHKWFGRHPDPLERALLIAATAVAPAEDGKVYGAALPLTRRLEATPPGGGLAWTPTAALDELLDAERHGRRIVFPRHGFAESVLDHVCAEYPLAQTDLIGWLGDLPTDPELAWAAQERERLARTFAALAVRCDAPEKITSKAREWTETRHDADLAFVVLSETCLDPAVGGRIRTCLYHWSREGRAPQTLKLTVARVCQVIAQDYPSVALTRLMHLATSGDAQVREEVAAVAVDLATRDGAAVFATMLRWMRTAGGRSHLEAGRRLDVAVRVLRVLLPGFGAQGVRKVLDEVDHLLSRGRSDLRKHLLTCTRALAQDHPQTVASFALYQAASADHDRRLFGARLLLALFADPGVPGPADAVARDPVRAAAVWATVLDRPADFRDAVAAFGHWLDAARIQPGLRPALVAAVVKGARPSPVRREAAVLLTRAWAAGDPGRRPVAEEVLIRVLLPEWRRWLLLLSVRVRGAMAGGR
ncbi:hypothetical protein [Actinocorallia aurea]